MTEPATTEFSIKGKTLKFDTAEDVKEYIVQLRKMDDLESVVLGGNTFGIEAAKAIANELKNKKNLKSVDLSDMFTGRLKTEIPPALDAFVEALEDKELLSEVDLSHNAFGPAGAKPLMRLIVNNRNVQVLKLHNNGLGIEGARLISLALIEAHEKNVANGTMDKLRMIVAGRNRMENPGAEHLSKAFKLYKDSLKHIQMPQNSIRPEGIAQLLSCIKDCSLEFLDLQDNTFTLIGSKALAEAFEHWPNLQYLNIGDCLLGGKGGIHVVKSLTKCCPDIKRIALFYNEINENGAKLIPAMIQHKKHLESLELNGNNFEGDGPVAQAIRDMLRSMGKDDVLDELDEMEIDSDAEEEEDEEETIEKPESSPELSDITELMAKVSVQ